MKNIILKSIFALGATILLSNISYAQETKSTGSSASTSPVKHEQVFVDKDGDGICDNIKDSKAGLKKFDGTGKKYGTEKPKGVCDGTGKGKNQQPGGTTVNGGSNPPFPGHKGHKGGL